MVSYNSKFIVWEKRKTKKGINALKVTKSIRRKARMRKATRVGSEVFLGGVTAWGVGTGSSGALFGGGLAISSFDNAFKRREKKIKNKR